MLSNCLAKQRALKADSPPLQRIDWRSMSDPGPAILLAPGAGAPSSHPRMQTFARMLATIGLVEPLDYPYALAGRGRPDPLLKLIEAHRAALAALCARHDGPIVLAGKSMGGRVGCHVALVDPVDGPGLLRLPTLRRRRSIEVARSGFARAKDADPVRAGKPGDSALSARPSRGRAEANGASSTLCVVEGGDHSLLVAKTALKAQGSSQEEVDDGVRICGRSAF